MTATAVFALRRDTWSAPEANAPQDVPDAESPTRATTVGRPAWCRHYDMRFADGTLPDALQRARPVLGCARAVNFRHGYFDQSAEVWGDDRTLLASSHQLVYYRD